MELKFVRESAEQIAVAIQKIVDVDVVIIDDKLERITDTFRYERDRIAIRKGSVVGRIIESGKPLAVDNKEVFRSCIDCPDRSRCQMQSMIGVPILHDGGTVGAIALVIPARRVKELFENLSHTLGFLEKMAEMLAGKLQAAQDFAQLSFAKRQREILIGAVEDAMVLVGEDGRIFYCNGTFSQTLLGGAGCTGQRLTDLIGHPQIERFFQRPRAVRNKLLYCETKCASFDGYLSVVPIELDGEYRGAVFIFRSIANVDAAFSETARKGRTIQGLLAHSPRGARLAEQAVAVARHGGPVLIQGGSGYRKRELAGAIHNASPRSGGNFLLMDCKKSAPEELEQELFGAPGRATPSKLRLAHKGTLCLCAVEYLPQYLQRRLADYLVQGTVVLSSSETLSDARLILTTSADLEVLTAQGLFDAGFYERMRDHRILLPAVSGQGEEVEAHFHRYLTFFAQRYGMSEIMPGPGLMDAVCATWWQGDLPQLRMVAEHLVKTAREGRITLDAFLVLGLPPLHSQEQPKSASALLEEQIRDLLDEGRRKGEIAQVLGISRATLYRKLKQYSERT